MSGLKAKDFDICGGCGRSVFDCRAMHFYTVTVEQHIADIPAIQRREGLAMQMGGARALADLLGPDEDLSHGMGAETGLICSDCSMTTGVAQILETLVQRREARETKAAEKTRAAS